MGPERRKYLAFRLMTGLFGIMPEWLARKVGRLMGRVAALLAADRLQLAARHMRRATGTETGALEAAREMFQSYGRYWAEVFWMRPSKQRAVVENTDIVGLERVQAAADLGNGVIFAIPHLGNWEAAGTKAAAIGFPVLAVAEDLPNKLIAKWFLDVRRTYGIDVVLADGSSNVMRSLIERLRSGGTVALPCDRDVTGEGVPVVFFGEETTMPAGPVALADRTGAALFPVGTFFKEGRGHRLVAYEQLHVPDAPTREERVAKGTQELAYRLEEIIKAAPTQWHIVSPNWPSDRR